MSSNEDIQVAILMEGQVRCRLAKSRTTRLVGFGYSPSRGSGMETVRSASRARSERMIRSNSWTL